MVDDFTIQHFTKLFLWLNAQHQPQLGELTGDLRFIYEKLTYRFTPIVDQELEKCLPTLENKKCDTLSLGQGHFLYLAPEPDSKTTKTRGFVPLLSIKCDFDKETPEVRFGMALGSRHNDDVRLFGMRFEAPEGDGTGLHDFYHTQMIHQFLRVFDESNG